MHTPTLNEAADYGSAFSRGMRIDLPEKTVLHISGTASVDEFGATVHLDDARKQIERMLVNVRELLARQGASFEDITQIATFLKYADFYEPCLQILDAWGIRHVPNTLRGNRRLPPGTAVRDGSDRDPAQGRVSGGRA